MDFHELMHVAASKQEAAMKKMKKQRYSSDLPAPKREEKNKPKSEAVQKLIQEKEREKHEKERRRREREQKEREEIERREKEEKKRNQFRIPKKKPESVEMDKKQLIDSLFDDDDDDEDSPQKKVEATPARGENKDLKATSSSSHSKSSEKDSKRHSSSHSSHRSSSSKDGKKSHSSSKENHSSSKSSSSTSKQTNGLSSSSSSNHKSRHSSSKSHRESSKSSSSHTKPEKASSKPESSAGDSESYKNPIPLTKNHLNPVQDRQAECPYFSEKAQILARLQAIRERTKAAIAMENEGKGKRVRGAKTQRKSKTDEYNEKAKSAEIVKDVVSSDEEDLNDAPSALDIMLSERNAKLEKDRIVRLAKQAWERATKTKEDEPIDKVRKHKEHRHRPDKNRHSLGRDKSSNHKVKRDGKVSPTPSHKQDAPRPKKPVIVKHAHNAPPPMNFQDILAIAEKKSKEPVKPAALLSIPKKKREEQKRPMTQEEKDRIERRKTKEYQDWLKYGGKQPKDNRRSSSSDSDEKTEQRPNSTHVNKLNSKPAGGSAQPKPGTNNHRHHKSDMAKPSTHRQNIPVNENLLVCGPGGDDDDSNESEDDVRAAPGNPFDRIMKTVHKKRPAPQRPAVPSKRMRIDSEEEEEEEDSDMDDFIDDGNDDAFDVSKQIQSLFGYDRSKFKNERDDDLYDMEANFSTVMAEEKRSAKLGLMEDLEDIKREEEELRLKAALKKKAMRRAK